MVRVLISLSILMGLGLFGCAAHLADDSAVSNQATAVGGDSAIKINLGGYGIENALIDIGEFQVTNAVFTLTDPDGGKIINTWSPGSPTYLAFTGRKAGAHSLEIVETDTFPKTFTATAIINVKKGFNYTINVVLGGNITMEATPAE